MGVAVARLEVENPFPTERQSHQHESHLSPISNYYSSQYQDGCQVVKNGLFLAFFVSVEFGSFGNATPGLAMNTMWGGRPDLVPRAKYPNDSILRGDEGVEVKASRQGGGWQGHNAESGWLCVVQFSTDNVFFFSREKCPAILCFVQ